MKKQIWIPLIALVLSSLACSITLPINLTSGSIRDVKTLEISESYSGSETVDLRIEMGGGDLQIEGGAQRLIEGTVRYNVDEWEPVVAWDGSSLTIRQEINTLPIQPNLDINNDWDLRLGNQAMAITILAGAYDGRLDFSGVPITHLDVQDGASNAEIIFNSPNPVRMEEFRYRTGASDIEVNGLAHANVSRFIYNGGAGRASIDFSGSLSEDMTVEISGGAGDVTITVPEGTHCVLRLDGELVDVDNNGWEENGDIYTVPGEGPTIEIEANLSVGGLELNIN